MNYERCVQRSEVFGRLPHAPGHGNWRGRGLEVERINSIVSFLRLSPPGLDLEEPDEDPESGCAAAVNDIAEFFVQAWRWLMKSHRPQGAGSPSARSVGGHEGELAAGEEGEVRHGERRRGDRGISRKRARRRRRRRAPGRGEVRHGERRRGDRGISLRRARRRRRRRAPHIDMAADGAALLAEVDARRSVAAPPVGTPLLFPFSESFEVGRFASSSLIKRQYEELGQKLISQMDRPEPRVGRPRHVYTVRWWTTSEGNMVHPPQCAARH